MRHLAIALLFCSLPSFAVNPDLSFTLTVKGGRITFQQGEPVTVELRLRAAVPGRYWALAGGDTRTVRISRTDEFFAVPADGVADPLRDIPAQIPGGMGGYIDQPRPMQADAIVVERDVNEFLSFRRPGRYNIRATTKRVRAGAVDGKVVPLESNALEIEIVAAEAAWAAEQARAAAAVLEARSTDTPETIRAARTLRFLETPEAARLLVRFFSDRKPADQQDLRAGLFGSPHRELAISAMQNLLDDSSMPVDYYWLGTLIELAAGDRLPPQPLYPMDDPEAQKRWMEEHNRYLERQKPTEAEYFARLAEAAPHKTGQARAVSLETVVMRGPKPVPTEAMKAFVDAFTDLPGFSQHVLLTSEWPRFATPEMESLVRRLAEKPGEARDAALARLLELDPAEGRRMAVARIRAGDFTTNDRALLLLPDDTLPEFDDAMVQALEQGKQAQVLIARYATAAVFPRVRAWSEQTDRQPCGDALLAYFYRVDPAYARTRIEDLRKNDPNRCAWALSPNEHLLMSEALEEQMIADLSDPSWMVRRGAQTALRIAGSAKAKQPLWDGLRRMREAPVGPMEQGVEFGFAEALLQGTGWVLSGGELKELKRSCITESCRSYVSSQTKAFTQPINISLMATEPGGVMVGTYMLRGVTALESKLGQYPRGTRFRLQLGYGDSWYAKQREAQILKALGEAGMIITSLP